MGRLSDTWQVERKDLSAFHKRTADLILALQKQGWKARHSQKNHVQLLAPDGVSTFATSNNEASYPIFVQKVNRYWQEHPEHDPAKQKNEATAPHKVQCPRPGCGKWFVDLDHLNVHINVDHEGLIKCPDCEYTHKLKRAVALHRARVHGYESPSKARRKAQEEKRALHRNDHVIALHDDLLNDEVCAAQIMDKAEILSIEPVERVVDMIVDNEVTALFITNEWRDVPVEDILDMDVRQLLYAYKAVGLTLRLQVRDAQ